MVIWVCRTHCLVSTTFLSGLERTLNKRGIESFINKPMLYIFPSREGNAAYFTINGYSMLINGGYALCAYETLWTYFSRSTKCSSLIRTIMHLGVLPAFLLRRWSIMRSSRTCWPCLVILLHPLYKSVALSISKGEIKPSSSLPSMSSAATKSTSRLSQQAQPADPKPTSTKKTTTKPKAGKPVKTEHKVREAVAYHSKTRPEAIGSQTNSSHQICHWAGQECQQCGCHLHWDCLYKH